MNRIRKQGDCAAFVFPDGECIAIEDTERVLMRILEVRTDEMDIAGALWGLAQDCLVQACHEAGVSYIRTAMQFSRDGAETAKRCLFLGLLMEQRDNYEAAAAAYAQALHLAPSRDDTWYAIYSNLGHALARCGRYLEAEPYCRAAVDIDPRRHNAVRHLGLALQGQGRLGEAAKAFLAAVTLCPEDLRAYVHLQDLLYRHEGIAADIPGIAGQVEKRKERILHRNAGRA